MTKHREKRGKKKDNRFDMVAEQRNPDNRNGNTSMKKLPNTLRVISEVERAALKVRPASVRGPCANCEEENRGHGNERLSGLGGGLIWNFIHVAEGVGFEPTVGF